MADQYREYMLDKIDALVCAGALFEIQDLLETSADRGDAYLDLDLLREMVKDDYVIIIFMNEIYFGFIVSIAYHWKISGELAEIVKEIGPTKVIDECVPRQGRHFPDALVVHGPVKIASVAYLMNDVLGMGKVTVDEMHTGEYYADEYDSVWHRMTDPKYVCMRDIVMKKQSVMKTFLCAFPRLIPDLAMIIHEYARWYAFAGDGVNRYFALC